MKQEIKHSILIAALLGLVLAGCQKKEEVPVPEAPAPEAMPSAPMAEPAPAPMESAPGEAAPMEPAPGDTPSTPPAQ